MLPEFDVSRETRRKLTVFLEMLRDENRRQNLVSERSMSELETRHIADSLQLIELGSPQSGRWIDLGTGAGFPGLIVALASEHEVTLVESRQLRVRFLQECVDALGVTNCVVVQGNAAELDLGIFDVISARAFAPMSRLVPIGLRYAGPTSRWVLPKGRNARAELEEALKTWHGDFRLVPSVTDADASIILIDGRPTKRKGRR